jgi:site-specific DNA-methyltransferase (adenine-specific)
VTTNERRRATATSNFGVSKRENHDATAFYQRFTTPDLSTDETVLPPFPIPDPVRVGDARAMTDLPDGSVALVVTSPPYFAGKQYEEDIARDGVPESYASYLQLLRDVFRECVRVLEPGGRIAVNVANLGRKPYRSLSADVVGILQDDLGLLLRGEVLWQKAAGAGGNCAWGSFRQATNPSLRDVTERVVIASKGRFDRALSVDKRRAAGLPHRSSVTADEFMAATLDVWQIPPESARRVAHPAPFPVELPERLVLLYTYEDDLVLDPFLGSGSALLAAARHGRRYVGYDTDPAYAAIAERRLAEELAELAAAPSTTSPAAAAAPSARPPVAGGPSGPAVVVPGEPASPAVVVAGGPVGGPIAGRSGGRRRRGAGEAVARAQALRARDAEYERRAVLEGKATPKLALELLEELGFTKLAEKRRLPGTGTDVSLVMADADGHPWLVDLSGAYTTVRLNGLRRPDLLWRAIGRAHVVANARPGLGALAEAPFLLLTSHLPAPAGDGDVALRSTSPAVVFDAVELLDPAGIERLRLYAKGGHHRRPAPGFWPAVDGPGHTRG